MENPEQTTSKLQTGKLKFFLRIQANFDVLGINPNLVARPYPFNRKIILGFFALILYGICNLMFIVCEAKTFAQYTQSIYMFSLIVYIILALAIVLLKVDELFHFINGCENLANLSELNVK